MLPHEVYSAVIAAAFAGIGAWVAVRVSLARVDQRLSDHMTSSDRRFERIEKVVGITGDPPAFLTAAEWRARMEYVTKKLDELSAIQQELRTAIINGAFKKEG